jgi:hypothetical protein
LPPLPAPADNAVMETDPPKRKRRRFQFSLRALLIFTMVVAIWAWGTRYVGSQLRIVRNRHEAAKTYKTISTLVEAYGPNGVLKTQITNSAPGRCDGSEKKGTS